MPAACPACNSSRSHTTSSKLLRNGTRRRCHHCYDCKHTWTSYDGPRPPHKGGSTARRGYRICPEEVEEMLANRTLSHAQMGAKLNLHKGTVRNVRLGHILGHMHPELPRWQKGELPTRTCNRCEHWIGGACDYGFPDPVEEGPAFAADCDLFQQR